MNHRTKPEPLETPNRQWIQRLDDLLGTVYTSPGSGTTRVLRVHRTTTRRGTPGKWAVFQGEQQLTATFNSAADAKRAADTM